MKNDYRILASDRDEMRRTTRRTRWIVTVTILISILLFAYPLIKQYRPSIRALRAARKLGDYLNDMKTRAILERTPLEAHFIYPDKIETYRVNSCGPNNSPQKTDEISLAAFYSGIIFVPENWVRSHIQTSTVMLKKFCYDPIFGSSVHADGLVYGSVFLMDSQELDKEKSELSKDSKYEHEYFDTLVEMQIRGETGDIQIQ